MNRRDEHDGKDSITVYIDKKTRVDSTGDKRRKLNTDDHERDSARMLSLPSIVQSEIFSITANTFESKNASLELSQNTSMNKLSKEMIQRRNVEDNRKSILKSSRK
jgi:hypothetical protein